MKNNYITYLSYLNHGMDDATISRTPKSKKKHFMVQTQFVIKAPPLNTIQSTATLWVLFNGKDNALEENQNLILESTF